MAVKRAVTRAVAVSSGALMAGALGIGTAAAMPSAPADSGGSNPLGGLTGTVSGTVNSTSNTIQQLTKTLGKNGKKLPKPLDKAVQGTTKDVQKTVDKVQQTVDSALGKVTKTQPAPRQPKPNQPGTHQRRGHHGNSGANGGRAAANGHRAGAAGLAMRGVDLARLDSYGVGAPGTIPNLPAGQMPSIAQPPAAHAPQVAAEPQHSLGYDLIHPSALIPRLEHDTTLQLELLIVAGALAGMVAGGHALHARRQLRTIQLTAAAQSGAGPEPATAESVETPAAEPAAAPEAAQPERSSRRRFAHRPGHALG